MRMYPRSEFPVETFPSIIRKNGSVNRAALAMRFGSVGSPNAKPEIAAAAIKAGYDVNVAFQIAILASQMHTMSMDCVERTCASIIRSTQRENAKQHPRGKCAEDIAARLEGRPSRWGTTEFHREPTPTKYYPA